MNIKGHLPAIFVIGSLLIGSFDLANRYFSSFSLDSSVNAKFPSSLWSRGAVKYLSRKTTQSAMALMPPEWIRGHHCYTPSTIRGITRTQHSCLQPGAVCDDTTGLPATFHHSRKLANGRFKQSSNMFVNSKLLAAYSIALTKCNARDTADGRT